MYEAKPLQLIDFDQKRIEQNFFTKNIFILAYRSTHFANISKSNTYKNKNFSFG